MSIKIAKNIDKDIQNEEIVKFLAKICARENLGKRPGQTPSKCPGENSEKYPGKCPGQNTALVKNLANVLLKILRVLVKILLDLLFKILLNVLVKILLNVLAKIPAKFLTNLCSNNKIMIFPVFHILHFVRA